MTEAKGKRPLRILEIVHNFPPFSYAGTELYTLNLSRELQNRGHDITVLYPIRSEAKAPYSFENGHYEDVRVTRFNAYDPKRPVRSDYLNHAFDKPFADYLSENQFDIVHFQHLYGLSASWLSMANAIGVPVCLKLDDMYLFCPQIHLVQNGEKHCSGPDSDKCAKCVCQLTGNTHEQVDDTRELLLSRKSYLQEVFRDADFVHATSSFLRDRCIRNGFSNDRFQVIPTGISPFATPPRPRNVLPNDRLRVAFLGHIDQRKGISDFLDAIEIYQAKLETFDAPTALGFDIYGQHYNDRLYRETLCRASSLKHTAYKGSFEPKHRSDIFSQIDLLVMPSIGENYPFVLREALFAGIPVVATDIAGIPEIVRHGQNGFLCPAGDVNALADLFVQVSTDADLLGSLEIESNKVKTIDVEAKEIEQEFYRLLDKNGKNDVTQLDPTTVEVGDISDPNKVARYFDQAKQLVEQGDLRHALAALSSVLERDPTHFDSIVLLGDLYNQLGNPKHAGRLWQVAQELQPRHLGVLKRLGHAVETSIIIPVFNQIRFTRKCLECIKENTPTGCYEIIVVDNHSTDGTREFLDSLEVKVIRNDENLGFSVACNQGAQAAAHELILFLNNDVEVHEGWLEPLVATLLEDPQVAVAGSKLLYPDGRIQHAGVITVDDVENNTPLDPWHIYHRLDGSEPQANIAREYPAVTAACLMTRKNVFEESGGFDPAYRNGFEDVDYCYRVGQQGHKIVYRPESVAIHHESQSGPERFAKNDANFEILVSRWQNKVQPDIRRWGVGNHKLLRPLKVYEQAGR